MAHLEARGPEDGGTSVSHLHVVRDSALDGPTNMARDEHLMHSAAWRPAALRIYGWDPPTLSLGCFQRFEQVAELPPEVRELAIVRRPTGGGAILHDREVTYCLVVDDSLEVGRTSPVELYRLVHSVWRDVLAGAGAATVLAPEEFPLPSPRTGPFFCFEKPGRTDLLMGEHKLLGSAQRRVSGRVLQHGSLMLGRRYAAHPGAHLDEPPPAVVADWVAAFTRQLAERLDLTPLDADWTEAALADVAARRAKYADDAWTRRR